MTNISTTDRSLSLRGGRSLPDEAIFSTVAEDCFASAGLAMTKWPYPDLVDTEKVQRYTK